MAMPVPTQAIDVMSLTLMALVNLVNLVKQLCTIFVGLGTTLEKPTDVNFNRSVPARTFSPNL